MSSNPPKSCVVGIGEALFDVFAAGPRLGGAPLNVAVHCHNLLRVAGGEGRVVSRIADDELGRKLLQQVEEQGLDPRDIQTDADAPTGRVDIEQYDDGGHTFHIAANSAWDEIDFTPNVESLARSCSAVAFGTLAQRQPTSRQAIQAFLDAAENAIKLFDVNLRSSDGTNFFDESTIRAGCKAADFVKLNDEELDTVCRLTETQSPEALVDRYQLRALILTRGAEGTTALTPAGWTSGEPVSYPRQDGADTVGAGDACSAGFLSALVLGRSLEEALHLANAIGAYVANQIGATPDLPDQISGWLKPA